MKDEQRISFTLIRDWLKNHRGISVSYDTVIDAYEYGRRQRGLPIAPKETPGRLLAQVLFQKVCHSATSRSS